MNLAIQKLLGAFFILAALIGPARAADLPEEAHARSGLPLVAAKLGEAGSELRVAFLGGSITAASGWRVGIMSHLKSTYPDHKFTEIFAAIPGTGSDFGASRVDGDALAGHPDLLFVEFAVNDIGRPEESIRRSMEGIVRKVRGASPSTDLCFVYTLSHAGLPYVESGQYPPPAAAMEAVADHYGIPTLHFGVEVVRQLHSGKLVFTGTSPSPGVPVFTADKIHPGTEGHKIYTETLARWLPTFLEKSAPTSASAPVPLETGNWEHATIFPVGPLSADSAIWEQVPVTDVRLSALPAALQRPTSTVRRPGVVLEFGFTGTVFGLYGIKGPDSGRFRVMVDDRPPVDGTFFDSFCAARRYRVRPWFYPSALGVGRHHVKVELLADGPDKSGVRAKNTEQDPAFDLNALTLSGVILDGPPFR